MFLTGKVVVHKADGVTRYCDAVYQMSNGSIAIWDNLPERVDINPSEGAIYQYDENRSRRQLEPDIIATEDQYERVHRKGHGWSNFSKAEIKRKLPDDKSIDDVDTDQLGI